MLKISDVKKDGEDTRRRYAEKVFLGRATASA